MIDAIRKNAATICQAEVKEPGEDRARPAEKAGDETAACAEKKEPDKEQTGPFAESNACACIQEPPDLWQQRICRGGQELRELSANETIPGLTEERSPTRAQCQAIKGELDSEPKTENCKPAIIFEWKEERAQPRPAHDFAAQGFFGAGEFSGRVRS